MELASHINAEHHVQLIEKLLTVAVGEEIIGNDDVMSVRSIYVGNMKWQIENFEVIKNWFAASGEMRLILSLYVVLICGILNFFK